MKPSLLRHLACPDCKGDLHLAVQERAAEEIVRGRLACDRCRRDYAIERGIPRFVVTDAYARSFSFQWNLHRTVQVDSLAGHHQSQRAFGIKTGFADEELNGKLVLDVGCGTGRYMEIAADRGAEVIGVDLSYAVEAAYRNMGRRPNIHVVQADVFRLPFRTSTFDAVYSIGVLHHTTSTRDAFLCLPPLLKPNGVIAIWVYEWAGDYSAYLDRVRRVTSRLPKRLLYGLCWVAVPLLHALLKVPVLRRLAWRIPTSHQGRGILWDVLDTFDLWSPRYQWKHREPEVRAWFEEAGLTDVRALNFPVAMRGRRMIQQAKAQAQAELCVALPAS
jgi:SAM-dependent methyltransferase